MVIETWLYSDHNCAH